MWVLKRCREEGLLISTNNQILVRFRSPKSQAEIERYTLENCAIDATIIREYTKKVDLTIENHNDTYTKANLNCCDVSTDTLLDGIIDNVPE